MKHLLTSLLSLLAIAATAQTATPAPSEMHVTDGTLHHIDMYRDGFGRSIPVDIWLPPTYDASRAEGYPVIYMHDGQNLFDPERTWNHQAWDVDSVAAALIADGRIEPPIVVGVYSNDETRISDLLPNGMTRGINPSLMPEFARMCPLGARGDVYVDFLADTLKPMVDSLYNTRTDPASTSVMGSSMGGLISLGALCRRPDVFGSAACLSTHITGFSPDTLFPTMVNAYLIENLPLDGRHRLYLDTGDTGMPDAGYTLFFPALVQTVRDLGYKEGPAFSHKIYPGHIHSESSWKERLADPLLFLVGK